MIPYTSLKCQGSISAIFAAPWNYCYGNFAAESSGVSGTSVPPLDFRTPYWHCETAATILDLCHQLNSEFGKFLRNNSCLRSVGIVTFAGAPAVSASLNFSGYRRSIWRSVGAAKALALL